MQQQDSAKSKGKITFHSCRQAGVIGDPIDHSLSPDIFDRVSHWTQIPLDYKKIRVKTQELPEFVCARRKLSDWIGWNVTLPHKMKMVELIDVPSLEIQTIQAVNVIKNKRGKLYGFNTDVLGIKETLREYQVEVESQNALIIGAGGAACGVAFVLGENKAQSVWIFNRTSEKAKRMVENFNSKFSKTKFHSVSDLNCLSFVRNRPNLFFQTTPVGMSGFPHCSLLPSHASKNDFAFDLVYRPIMTPFLKNALAKGMKIAGGMDMLVWQALATWEIWMEQGIENKSLLKDKICLALNQSVSLSSD